MATELFFQDLLDDAGSNVPDLAPSCLLADEPSQLGELFLSRPGSQVLF